MNRIVRKQILSGGALLCALCLLLTSVILINATMTTYRLDLTENKLFTLSAGTRSILQNLEEPILLDFYFSQQRLLDYPQLANYGVRVRDMLNEYVFWAEGKLLLRIVDPAPFSEREDQAVATGMRSIPVGGGGERAWFGLAGSNSTDDERIIPFFQTNREALVEYDLTKLIYNLAYPDKRVLGVTGSLSLFGDKQTQQPEWAIISSLKEFFEVRDLGKAPQTLDPDIDVLLVVHPKDFADVQYYALDQYLLRGGKAMIFLDPLAEQDRSQPPTDNSMVLPKLNSSLQPLFAAWGLELPAEKLVGDINAAMRVQASGPRGAQEVDYLPWLRLDERNMNAEDIASAELNLIHLGTSGSLELMAETGIEFTPLLQTSLEAMQLPRDLILFQSDPAVILNNFASENRRFVLAARLRGEARTAYPEGQPLSEEEQAADTNFVSSGKLNAIVLADTDILADHFWVRTQSVGGQSLPRPIANNGDFVINSIENLAGDTNLATLRTRDKFARPFVRVERLRKEAETQFLRREQELRDSLEDTEEKIRALQQESGDEGRYLLTSEQNKELEKFRQLRLQTRKELRAVQHDLQKNIENLGSRIRFLNILLLPLLITLLALGIAVIRSLIRARRAAT